MKRKVNEEEEETKCASHERIVEGERDDFDNADEDIFLSFAVMRGGLPNFFPSPHGLNEGEREKGEAVWCGQTASKSPSQNHI